MSDAQRLHREFRAAFGGPVFESLSRADKLKWNTIAKTLFMTPSERKEYRAARINALVMQMATVHEKTPVTADCCKIIGHLHDEAENLLDAMESCEAEKEMAGIA